MWNTPLQTVMVSILIAVSVSLSACDSSKQNTVEGVASGISAKPSSPDTSAQSDTTITDTTIAQAPVHYDISSWHIDDIQRVNIGELDSIQATFGAVVTTDKNSLDYASNPATKYRFMKTDAPYRDIIDSQNYLELGWYYANPTDSDKDKAFSQKHAKKAYTLSQQLMGEEGGKLITDMLNGQIIKDKTIAGQKVELAKCEFYSCMLILNKDESAAPLSDG